MRSLWLFLFILLALAATATAQMIVPLYSGAIPNSRPSEIHETTRADQPGLIWNVTNPALEAYLPEAGHATGAAVIICPGGAYGVIVYQMEGARTAREFARNGVAAFVLKYRLPNDTTMVDKKIGPLQDAQQAIRLVRSQAARWGINPSRVGIMGFSAGGHLAATAATHFVSPVIDTAGGPSVRPDFAILVYPVVSMQDSLTHRDSRTNLLGRFPTAAAIREFSNELQVTDQTPPTYLTHAGDDKVVDVDNSIGFYEQLRHHHVPAEMHLYPKGGHGFVLFQKADDWMQPLFRWMRVSGWMGN